MPKTYQIKTNFSGGELSPQIEGRPDLAKFFNGAKRLENWGILYEGGIFRRYGTKKIAEVKNSDTYVRGIPFKFSNSVAYFIEAGHGYFRFYRRGLNGSDWFSQIKISAGAPPLEIVTPYSSSDFIDMQWVQSADVLYITHPNHQQRTLNRVSDTEWFLSIFLAEPPPSYEADTDITLKNAVPAATSGDGAPSDSGDGAPSDDGGDGDGGGDTDDSDDSDDSDDGGGDGGDDGGA